MISLKSSHVLFLFNLMFLIRLNSSFNVNQFKNTVYKQKKLNIQSLSVKITTVLLSSFVSFNPIILNAPAHAESTLGANDGSNSKIRNGGASTLQAGIILNKYIYIYIYGIKLQIIIIIFLKKMKLSFITISQTLKGIAKTITRGFFYPSINFSL